MTSESGSSINGGQERLGVLGQIFGKGEIGRMERVGRVARCKSIATQLINAQDIPDEYKPALAELRILLRGEYMHAVQEFIQGECASVAVPAAEVGSTVESAEVKRSGLRQFMGALKWTR